MTWNGTQRNYRCWQIITKHRHSLVNRFVHPFFDIVAHRAEIHGFIDYLEIAGGDGFVDRIREEGILIAPSKDFRYVLQAIAQSVDRLGRLSNSDRRIEHGDESMTIFGNLEPSRCHFDHYKDRSKGVPCWTANLFFLIRPPYTHIFCILIPYSF